MPSARVALLALAVAGIGLATPALATPRCTKTCRRDTAACIRTTCALLGGQARQNCLNKCRGSGGCGRIGTLAYVVSTCTVSGAFHQKLQVRHGGCDPVTVLDFPEPLDFQLPRACTISGVFRAGVATSAIYGAFHRMGVSLDGRHVVFEVTDDFTSLGVSAGVARPHLVPPEQQEGIFIVRADGRGLRRLGPASRDPSFRVDPVNMRAGGAAPFCFSPDGREVVLTDLGPGPGGEEAVQIFTLDLVTGQRSEPLTQLPFVRDHAVGAFVLYPGTGLPCFVPDGRITFLSFGNLDRSNPEGSLVNFIMNRDGSDLKRLPLPVVLPGSHVIPSFGIVGASVGRSVAALSVAGPPVNPTGFGDPISEIFLLDGKAVIQLTNFHRVDTGFAALTPDGQRAIFVASADPLGTNPSGTCQLFSADALTGSLRQLTHFSQPEYSVAGCNAALPPGCLIIPSGLDPATGIINFYSSCDPFGTNPYGDQVFDIHPDGKHLRQLTHARGWVRDADGNTVSAENILLGGYSASAAAHP